MPLNRLVSSDDVLPAPDVQQTTFSVDVLGRYVCNTLGEALTNPDFDAIVIGSGMYGGYFASKLFRQSIDAGHPLRVLVLEAGPFLLPEHGQNLPEAGIFDPSNGPFDTRDDQNQNLKNALVWGIGWRSQTRFPGTAYCVGGKSLFWGGWCPRLTDKDLEQWPAEVREYLNGKPKVGADAKTRASIYEAVEYEVGARPTDDFIFDPVAGPGAPAGEIGLNRALHKLVSDAIKAGATNDPLKDVLPPPIAVQTQSFISGLFAPDKYSSVPAMISAIRSGDNGGGDGQKKFFLVPNTHVRRLVCPPVPKDGATPDSYRVHGIEVISQGVRQTIPVKPTCMVVLALGAIESTRLALESFPTAPGRRDQELMGRNLMAHLRFDFGFRLDRKKLSDRMKAELGHPLADRLQSASLHVQGFGDHGRFHYQVYSASRPNSSGDEIYRMIPDPDVATKLEDMESKDRIAVIFRACGEMKGVDAPVGAPGTNWIDLAGEGDRDQLFDHARAWVHYENPQDAPIWKEMHTAAVKLAKAMGAVEFPGGGDKFENLGRAGVGTTWHDAGTLRMGDDPKRSVTDVNGRFHHIANAACVDQALFPTVGSANPVLTGTCLARKVCEELVARYTSQPDLAPADVTREESDGFVFLLKGGNAAKWKANDTGRVNRPNPRLAGDTILEVAAGAGTALAADASPFDLAVLFFDDPAPFRDFVLRLQWKAFFQDGGDITANSGVFLRAPAPPQKLTDDNFYKRAIEIQIDETGYDFAARRFRSPLHRTGAIYEIAPAHQWAAKVPSTDGTDGLWNDYEITASGDRVTVRLNGKLVSDGTVTGKGPSGAIGFQYHTGKVQFRNVRVKRLPAPA